MASERLDRDHNPVFAQIDAFFVRYRWTRRGQGTWAWLGRDCQEEISKKYLDVEGICVAKRWESQSLLIGRNSIHKTAQSLPVGSSRHGLVALVGDAEYRLSNILFV